MRIGIDVRPLQAETKHRGIGKSLEFFLKEALPLFKKDSLVFYIDGNIEPPEIIRNVTNSRIINFNSLAVTRKKYIRSVVAPWRALKPNPKDIDVLLQYDGSLGIPSSVPTVVIFHDLIPYLFHKDEVMAAKSDSFKRTLKNRLAGLAYWQQYLRFLKRYKKAKTIIAISDSSKSDYINYFNPTGRQRILTIPHGVDNSFFETPPPLSKDLSKQLTEPFFIYIGGIDYRKNIQGLLHDFLEVRKSHKTKLILVGKEFALQDQLDDLGWQKLLENNEEYAKDIVRPGYVSHEDLIALLAQATALVFPSKYEGFGMPLLEAMAVGCPVITYGNSSLKEVVGADGTIVPDGVPLTMAMEAILQNPSKFTPLAINARKRARTFTWNHTAKSIIDELYHYNHEKKDA